MNPVTLVLTVGAVLGLVAWFDARLLTDLARTPERNLRYLTRVQWAVVIIASFPIGPILYLAYAKGPRRYV
jgi:hypothetical protein